MAVVQKGAATMLLLEAVVIGFIAGILVALGTARVLTPEKARRYPGGSMSCGAMFGFAVTQTWEGAVIGGLCGIIGWIVYVMVSKNP